MFNPRREIRKNRSILKSFLSKGIFTMKSHDWSSYPFHSVADTLKTIQDYVRWVFSLLNQAELSYGHGTDNAWDEATSLVLTALHLPPDADRTILQAKLLPPERQKIIEWTQQRLVSQKPLPYISGKAYLGGLEFWVNEHVLIPRSPMVELIEQAFEPWIDPENIESVLDLCTGSGSLAILTAQVLLEAHIDAVDISTDALVVAKKNVSHHHLNEQISCIQSDLFEKLPEKQYDLILSNPPYVSESEYQSLPKEYHHEPVLALKADNQGLAIVERILKEAHHHLTPGGILIVEVGSLQPVVEDYFSNYPFTWLQFERGGEGVFLLTQQELLEAQNSHER